MKSVILCIFVVQVGGFILKELGRDSNNCLNNIFKQNKRLFIIDPYKKVPHNFGKHEIVYVTEIKLINKYETLRDFKHFLMYLESEDDLIHIIKQLNGVPENPENSGNSENPRYSGWKPKYYHYILFSSSLNKTRIFEVLWSYYIFNTLLIENNKIFTYFPFSGCNNITSVYVGNCTQIYFPQKIPNTLSKCEYRFLGLPRPPFVLNINVLNDNPKRQGFEVTLINNIVTKLNITLKHIPNPFRDWGALQPNGTFTEMFGLLQKKYVDVMYGGFHYNYVPAKYFDITVTHKIVNNAWYVPSPLQIPEWQNLLIVFQTNVWLLLLATLIAKTTYWSLATKKPMDQCFLYIWSMFLLISIKPPKTLLLKMQFYICTVSFVIITTAYLSKLFGVLTKPIYEKPITSVDELLKNNLKVGFHPAYANRINDSQYAFLLEDYIKCSAGFECMNRTAFQRDFAVIKLDVQTAFMIPRFYTSPSGRPLINWFNELIGHSHLGFYTIKGLPILDKINNIIYRCVESGLINKWEEDTKYVTRKETGENLKPLTLHHLQTPFYVLLFGVVISSSVFFFEIIINVAYILKKRNKY